MSIDLRQGFRLGPWKVEPLRGVITGTNGLIRHIEPKVMDVLVCLAEQPDGLATRDQLLEAVWSEHAAADELLTGAVSDLRRALQDDRDASQYIETLPKRGYRLIGEVRPIEYADSEESAPPGSVNAAISQTRRRMLWAAGFSLVVVASVLTALNVGGIRDRLPGVATPKPVKSIAVLPFVNISPETGQEWFADGLTEEILNSLARTPDLLVAARTSSFNYRDTNKDIPEIAKALGVEHILEGSVRRSGERLRVTAQLVRAADGFHVWSESYDRTMEDVIRIQEEVAIQIANALETAMDPEALARMVSAGTTSVPAYEAYLRGLSLAMTWFVSADVDEYLAAIDGYERAIALDPEFALAYSEIADFWRRQLRIANYESGQSGLSITEISSRFEEAMDKAIQYERDPVRQIFYRARKAMVEMKFLQALRLVTSYLEKRPYDHDAQVLKLSILPELAMYEEAAQAVDEFYARDGYSVIVTLYSFLALNFSDDHDALREFAEKSIERFPENVSVLYQAHRALLFLGDVDSAGRILPIIEASDLKADNRALAALRQACAEGKTGVATQIFDNLLANHPDDISAIWLSRKIFGRDDEATRMLRVFDNAENMTSLASFLRYGHFDPSQYPNLRAILAAQGIEPRSVKNLPYRCRN